MTSNATEDLTPPVAAATPDKEPSPHSYESSRIRLFDIRDLGTLLYEHITGQRAETAVIIPLYNYGRFIAECLQSVVEQDRSRIAIVIVDDFSTDGGGDIAADYLKTHCDRFTMARVVRHRRNLGLAMSRNSGIVWSAEPLLFMLDADNRIRPPAISRLEDALISSGAEFAYSQLWRFGAQDMVGGADIWDPRSLIWGNYLDAMALIRRDALLTVGGYAVSAVEHGWEDYDLWCSFAESGFSGVFLPELLCEYRVHNSSMLHTRTDQQKPTLMAEMALRHPALFNAV